MNSAKELAAKGIIEGKPLREWVDAPYGAFAKAVREKVDPYFGLEPDSDAPVRKYKVTVHYSYTPEPETEYSSITYEVEAPSPEIAKDMAQKCWDNAEGDYEAGEDHEIDSIDEPEMLPDIGNPTRDSNRKEEV